MKPQNSPAASEEVAPTTPVEQPAETPATPETTSAPETDEDEPEETETAPGEETAPPVETPDATASAPQRLNAFDRGALRLLGKGDLVARTERAEAEVARLTTENTRLATELAQFKAETPKQIAQAAAGRKNEVAKGVAAELAGLGISPEAAPGKIDVNAADKIVSREDAQKAYAAAKTPEDRRAIYNAHRDLLF